MKMVIHYYEDGYSLFATEWKQWLYILTLSFIG